MCSNNNFRVLSLSVVSIALELWLNSGSNILRFLASVLKFLLQMSITIVQV